MHIGTLHPTQPYDLHRTASLLSRYHGVLDVYQNGEYLRALHTQNGIVLVRVEQNQTVLEIYLLAGELSDSLIDLISSILAVDFDLSGFYALAMLHSRLAPIIESLYGLRHFQSETVFEALMTVIIEQQISLYAALRAQRALAEWGGSNITHEGKTYFTFPTVETIAHADPLELHSILKITHRRVALMQRIAHAVLDGSLDLEGLRSVKSETAYQTLMAIKGVGHWTAAWTLIRGLNCYDYVGHNDVALRSAVAYYFYDTEERVSADTVTDTFAQFSPYAGLAAFYTLMQWAVERY